MSPWNSNFQWKWNKPICRRHCAILHHYISIRFCAFATGYWLSISSCVTDKQLQFNATKCRQTLISRKRAHSSTPPPNLYVSGTALLQVSEYKYLGVIITSDLSWRPHITNMCNKTRKLIGLLYRRFYQSSNSSILLKLYLSFVRPHWSFHLLFGVHTWKERLKRFRSMCLKSVWSLGILAMLTYWV